MIFHSKLVKKQDLVYFLNMKILIFILVLAISAQPLQAGFCDMDLEKNQKTSHHMTDSDQEDSDQEISDQDRHDCCDSDQADSQDGCDGQMNCGFCFASVPALPGMIRHNPVWANHYFMDYSSAAVLPSHSTPLFRPPIS